MAFTTFSYVIASESGGTITQGGGAIVSDADVVHTETGTVGTVNNILEDQEVHSTTLGTQQSIYEGSINFGGEIFYVFELSPGNPGAGLTHIIASVKEGSNFASIAEFPNNIVLANLDKTDEAHCFVTGTLIATPTGECAVEALNIGDMITNADGKDVPVKWVGRKAIPFVTDVTAKLEPVRIRAGALGNDLPTRDLTVSADHGMILDGMVVNASALVNGNSIAFVPFAEFAGTLTYYHIETEAHDVILAEGSASETFIDTAGRKAFDNYAEYTALYGAERMLTEMALPRITSSRLLPATLKARVGLTTPAPITALSA